MTDDIKPTTDDNANPETTAEETEGTEETQEAVASTESTKEAAAPAPAASEAPKEEQKDVEVPAKFKKIVEDIEQMTVLELNELVKVFEEKFGVSATAVAAAAPGAGGAAAEEKDSFNVELTGAGANKIAVIKVVKEAAGLGLKEAKDLVESAPAMVKEGLKKEDAEGLKQKLEEAGATVTLK